ncbi:DUF5522 domain-containing protein [Flavobacterium humi]|uniref:Cysteine-rich CWC family protein n=1 Tax=Flavobacterium humi TaxID=2562683 RepID=A0A4Z0L6F5_9FLAO|nr:DUF5522 domain-containing protein [Flavobacterium humi]TGD56696.1 hypothetical protein E4635_14735 [Flavobacterium humi]
MNVIKVKNCSTCGIAFDCGDTPAGIQCWCNGFPPIFSPSDVIDCLCPVCFKSACAAKIDEYVAGISPQTAPGNKAKDLPETTNLLEGIDYYIENGNYVFKPWYHLKRGFCCQNGCRHCPY